MQIAKKPDLHGPADGSDDFDRASLAIKISAAEAETWLKKYGYPVPADLAKLLARVRARKAPVKPEGATPDAPKGAPDLAMPGQWFESEFSIPKERLRSAVRSKRLAGVKRNGRLYYSVKGAQELWPEDHIDPAGASASAGLSRPSAVSRGLYGFHEQLGRVRRLLVAQACGGCQDASATGRRPTMRITEREPGDVGRLEEMIGAEARARHRDRLRMVLLALRGGEKEEIARTLGVAKSTVEGWVYRYRDGGLEAVKPKKRAGRKARLTAQRAAEFKARFTAAPKESDGVCTLRAKDAVRILNDEFKVNYSISGTYDLLHRLGLSCLVPRPRHEKNDPVAMEAFKQSAPLLSRK